MNNNKKYSGGNSSSALEEQFEREIIRAFMIN